MGSRGSSGDSSVTISRSIRDEFINMGLNSKLKGVKRDAENGTGNYSYKNAQPISDKDINKMKDIRVHNKNGKTLLEGRIGQKSVVYGNTTESEQIQKVKKYLANKKQKQVEDMKNMERPDITTTSTYDRWKKKHDKDFAAWFGREV